MPGVGNEPSRVIVSHGMTDEELIEFRQQKDVFFKEDHRSPVDDQASFSGLSYYAPEPAYRFRVDPIPADGETVVVQTSDGRRREYRRSARVTLSAPEGPIELSLFTTQGSHGFFVPFRDATSGSETYGAGRYLDIEPNEDGTVTVDFNLAYNPYCAYSEAYSCPLPPLENWLQIPIPAGEKSFEAT
jgi:uncharacterized protein (DUF1684 family)